MLPEVLDPAVSRATAVLELPSCESPSPSFFMTLESPLDSKEIKPVNPKGNQS